MLSLAYEEKPLRKNFDVEETIIEVYENQPLSSNVEKGHRFFFPALNGWSKSNKLFAAGGVGFREVTKQQHKVSRPALTCFARRAGLLGHGWRSRHFASHEDVGAPSRAARAFSSLLRRRMHLSSRAWTQLMLGHRLMLMCFTIFSTNIARCLQISCRMVLKLDT